MMSVPILVSVLLVGLYVLKCASSEQAVRPAPSSTPATPAPDDLSPAAEPEALASAVEPEPAAEPAALASAVEPEPAVADDLTRIWGLGKSAAERLQAAGIVTFRQLAALDEAQLIEIFGGPRMKMDTWPEQARLAADGDWQALDALIKEL
ncbi:MAG: hypothetical protein ETSY1_10290 [Candidatus Entotheonella factor]|uniref:DUF4332 domain-containing protein n=1 Tax=Entotheonella factor TaxID=1429438 RepID=W4LRS8_ENTF1|nr:MAG: hypothetical protein ETSY1_10290 [Candidatus Entotheonella factor]